MIYFVFRLFDNSALVAIIVISLYNGILSSPTAADLALITAVGIESFYDIMINVNKYWVLHRLSFYIGIVLYVIYFSIVSYQFHHDEISSHQFNVIMGVLAFRLAAFLLEELTDIGIEFCIHNLLLDSERIKSRTHVLMITMKNY